VKNALSSTIALFVVGACLLIAGLLMVRAAIRARLTYRRALKTRRRVAGKVVGHKTHADEGSTLWSPVVEYDDPRTGRRATYSPAMYSSFGKLAKGREVEVLWDERGREPILNVRPYRTGFAGHILFIIMAVMCVALGALAVYATVF